LNPAAATKKILFAYSQMGHFSLTTKKKKALNEIYQPRYIFIVVNSNSN
jgi:hypothetical protein